MGVGLKVQVKDNQNKSTHYVVGFTVCEGLACEPWRPPAPPHSPLAAMTAPAPLHTIGGGGGRERQMPDYVCTCVYACGYGYVNIYIYIYANPPPRRTRCRDTATNRLMFRLLVYDPVLKFRRESICMTAAAFILNSLRPLTQTLRKMINDESFCLNTRRSIWARILIPKIASLESQIEAPQYV